MVMHRCISFRVRVSRVSEKGTLVSIVLRRFILVRYNEALSLYIAWPHETYTYLHINKKFGKLYYVACLNRGWRYH